MASELELKQQRELEAMQAINRELTRMLEAVPGRSDQAGLEMFMQILSATSPDELDKPWNGNGIADYLDQHIIITDVHKEVSSYADGPGYFLVCPGVEVATGQAVTFITSSVQEMAQILVAYTNGWLPWHCVPRIAAKPTAKGYYPRHLETWRAGVTALGDGNGNGNGATLPPGYKPGDNLKAAKARSEAAKAAATVSASASDDEPGF